MTVNYEEMRQKILSSASIRVCPKPPCPRLSAEQPYVFISYSHRDYRAVYCDLLRLHEAGVRFWYDEGLPAGEEWDAIVEKKIRSPQCSGVVFYMSENLFLSDSIFKEIRYTREAGGTEGNIGKRYFCVNLEKVGPSGILRQIFRKYPDGELYGIDSGKIAGLMAAFSDKATYIERDSAGSAHLERFLGELKNRFHVVVPRERKKAWESPEEEIVRLKRELQLARNFQIDGIVLKKYIGTDAEVVIPDGIWKIGEGAFANCSHLTRVICPVTLRDIGDSAFAGCVKLKEVTFSDHGGLVLYRNAFAGCESLTRIVCSESMAILMEGAFRNCRSLTEIVLSTLIDDTIFEGCDCLKTVTLPRKYQWAVEWGGDRIVPRSCNIVYR